MSNEDIKDELIQMKESMEQDIELLEEAMD